MRPLRRRQARSLRRNSARRRRCSGHGRAWCRILYSTSSPPRLRPHNEDTLSPCLLIGRIAEQHPRQVLGRKRDGAPLYELGTDHIYPPLQDTAPVSEHSLLLRERLLPFPQIFFREGRDVLGVL